MSLPLAPRTHGNLLCPRVVGSRQRDPPHPAGPADHPPPQKLPSPKTPHRPETKKFTLKSPQTDGAGLDTNLGSCKSKNASGHLFFCNAFFSSVEASTFFGVVFLQYFFMILIPCGRLFAS